MRRKLAFIKLYPQAKGLQAFEKLIGKEKNAPLVALHATSGSSQKVSGETAQYMESYMLTCNNLPSVPRLPGILERVNRAICFGAQAHLLAGISWKSILSFCIVQG